MSKAVATVHIDNEHVRVTEWAFEPGAATGWHRHGFDYVITPVIGGVVEIEDGVGKRTRFEVAPFGYHRRMEQVCELNDILYVSDEVVTSFGRLGHFFSSTERFDSR